ncbi:MAG: methionine adenosyltransferase [Bacteroidales bacterium]|nr:methionine adenosyltransferase [Bacteroidales bacterium]MBP5614268.1 methionine adenosyltransferase [Bacteroidales bacterium]
MKYLFTSESVSEGHPDKVADQISDALLDAFLREDSNAKVACETMVTTGMVFCSGEVKTHSYVDIQETARQVIREIGYTKGEYMFESNSCGIISAIHGQSPDITQGVEKVDEEEQGAGDQGLMFGYACKEMENYMPVPIEIAHRLVQELAAIRKEGSQMTYLRPDAKSQVTVEYDDGRPVRIDTIVLSTQHDEFLTSDEEMLATIRHDVETILIPRVKATCPPKVQAMFGKFRLLVNPTGKFVVGGPHGDTGLTGRKIIVDTYGGKAPHGGGAFSGKDSSKVDRSAAYAARHIAKNLVAAGIADEVLVQIAYAIGIAEPVGLYVRTFGTCRVRDAQGQILSDDEIVMKVKELFDLRPYAICKRLGLRNPIFLPTASYGHFGRDTYEKEVEVFYEDNETVTRLVDGTPHHYKKVTFFAWEKTDAVDDIRKAFSLE